MCKKKIFTAMQADPCIRNRQNLELEISTLSDGLAMQFIRYYRDDLSAGIDDIIAFGKNWGNEMVSRRSGKADSRQNGSRS